MILRSLSLDRAASSLVPRSSRVTTDEAFNAFSIWSLSSTTLIHHRVSKPRGLVSRGKNLRSTQKKFLFFFLPPSRFGSKFDRLSTRSSTVALRGRNVCEWRNWEQKGGRMRRGRRSSWYSSRERKKRRKKKEGEEEEEKRVGNWIDRLRGGLISLQKFAGSSLILLYISNVKEGMFELGERIGSNGVNFAIFMDARAKQYLGKNGFKRLGLC